MSAGSNETSVWGQPPRRRKEGNAPDTFKPFTKEELRRDFGDAKRAHQPDMKVDLTAGELKRSDALSTLLQRMRDGATLPDSMTLTSQNKGVASTRTYTNQDILRLAKLAEQNRQRQISQRKAQGYYVPPKESAVRQPRFWGESPSRDEIVERSLARKDSAEAKRYWAQKRVVKHLEMHEAVSKKAAKDQTTQSLTRAADAAGMAKQLGEPRRSLLAATMADREEAKDVLRERAAANTRSQRPVREAGPVQAPDMHQPKRQLLTKKNDGQKDQKAEQKEQAKRQSAADEMFAKLTGQAKTETRDVQPPLGKKVGEAKRTPPAKRAERSPDTRQLASRTASQQPTRAVTGRAKDSRSQGPTPQVKPVKSRSAGSRAPQPTVKPVATKAQRSPADSTLRPSVETRTERSPRRDRSSRTPGSLS